MDAPSLRQISDSVLITVQMQLPKNPQKELDEEVAVVNTFSNTGCFNLSASQGNITEGELISFNLARGVITNVGYDGINLPGSGETLLSITADYKCCSVFCERFSRQISDGEWIFGKVRMHIEEEANVGISYNGVQVCHASYLEGIFGNTVTFSPFALEGIAPECIGSIGSRKYRQFRGVGRVVGISAVTSSSTLTLRFAFALSQWSRDFMLKFMKENEHGTLGNVYAEVVIRKAQYQLSGLAGNGIYFIAITGFAYGILLLAIILLMCTRSKRAFLKQTWITYNEYHKLHRNESPKNVGTDNIALHDIS
eukprot:gene16568-7991_t